MQIKLALDLTLKEDKYLDLSCKSKGKTKILELVEKERKECRMEIDIGLWSPLGVL
jgi:hypothetical protein